VIVDSRGSTGSRTDASYQSRVMCGRQSVLRSRSGERVYRSEKKESYANCHVFLASVFVMSAGELEFHQRDDSGSIRRWSAHGDGHPSKRRTGVRLSAKSTEAGNYLFAPLQRGRYTIQAEAAGFKKTERPGLDLRMGDKLGVDIKLEMGNVQETVEVRAESPLLTTTNGSIGQVISNDKIMELPLPGAVRCVSSNSRPRSAALTAISPTSVWEVGVPVWWNTTWMARRPPRFRMGAPRRFQPSIPSQK